MTQVLPAKSVNKVPQFQFAVLSVRKGNDIADLESSFESEGTAKRLFSSQYSKWGLTDTNFYLVDWQNQSVLAEHVVWAK